MSSMNSKVWRRPFSSYKSWGVVPDVTPTVSSYRNRHAVEFKFLVPVDGHRKAEVSLVIDGEDFQDLFAAMLKSGMKR